MKHLIVLLYVSLFSAMASQADPQRQCVQGSINTLTDYDNLIVVIGEGKGPQYTLTSHREIKGKLDDGLWDFTKLSMGEKTGSYLVCLDNNMLRIRFLRVEKDQTINIDGIARISLDQLEKSLGDNVTKEAK